MRGGREVAKLKNLAGGVGVWVAFAALFLFQKIIESSGRSDSGPLPDPSFGGPSNVSRPKKDVISRFFNYCSSFFVVLRFFGVRPFFIGV